MSAMKDRNKLLDHHPVAIPNTNHPRTNKRNTIYEGLPLEDLDFHAQEASETSAW